MRRDLERARGPSRCPGRVAEWPGHRGRGRGTEAGAPWSGPGHSRAQLASDNNSAVVTCYVLGAASAWLPAAPSIGPAAPALGPLRGGRLVPNDTPLSLTAFTTTARRPWNFFPDGRSKRIAAVRGARRAQRGQAVHPPRCAGPAGLRAHRRCPRLVSAARARYLRRNKKGRARPLLLACEPPPRPSPAPRRRGRAARGAAHPACAPHSCLQWRAGPAGAPSPAWTRAQLSAARRPRLSTPE